jgi:hypothetical protein
MEEEVKKFLKVVIIKNNLLYRIKGFKGGESFVPNIGQIIRLPEEIALKELKTGNVRELLPEEEKRLADRKLNKKKAK